MTVNSEFVISEVEMEAIEELKRRLACDLNEKQHEDTYLFYRFLKARDFDLKQAEDMLRKHIQWRTQTNMDTITTDYTPPEVLREYVKHLKICPTKYGSNAYYMALGKYDCKGIILSAKYIDREKIALKFFEEEMKYQKQTKREHGMFPGFFVILDQESFSFASATDKMILDSLLRFAKTFQDNYPECLSKIFVINASIYFTMLSNFIKPFLGPALINKFHIFSKDDWQEELLKHIEADDLPAFLGGKKTDPDGNPLCLQSVSHGGPVPASYHIHKSKRSLATQSGVKKLVLARAAFSEIKVQVDEPGSLLEWEFETKNRDIGFGLFRKEGEGEKEVVHELVPLQRLETDNFSESGLYKCEKAGTYVMLFDNSYSWIRSKEIYYTMKVISGNEQDGK